MVFETSKHGIPEGEGQTGTESIDILLLNATKSYKLLITSLSSDGAVERERRARDVRGGEGGLDVELSASGRASSASE